MKNYKLIYNAAGYLQEPIEESEFYVAQQEEGSVAFTATFPAFLVGKVKAYIEFKGGGEIIECGDINLNSNSVTLTLSSSDYLIYNFLKVGFEVVTSTAQIRFQPVEIEVDEFVNVTGTGTKQAYTVSVKIGTVTPLENGEDPYVENVGTGKDVVLNFGLPKMDVDSVLSNESTNPVQNRVVSDALAGKADITWIEPKNFQESVFFHEKLDALTEEGIYGLRNGGFNYGTDYSGNPTGEVTFEPHTTSYVIVTTEKEGYPYLVRQLLLDAEEGMKLRSGTIEENEAVAWEEWEQHATKNELSQKADITWLDIEASSADAKEDYLYPQLDTITDPGLYGIRPYEVLDGGEDGNEEFHVPIYNEYLMVSTRGAVKYKVSQLYIDADKGIRIRHGKRQSNGSIAWGEWKEYVTEDALADRLANSTVHVGGITAANPQLFIEAYEELNLKAIGGDVFFEAKDENDEIKRTSVLTILNEIQSLKERVAALESVNEDLERIIEMQKNYIGGDEV